MLFSQLAKTDGLLLLRISIALKTTGATWSKNKTASPGLDGSCACPEANAQNLVLTRVIPHQKKQSNGKSKKQPFIEQGRWYN